MSGSLSGWVRGCCAAAYTRVGGQVGGFVGGWVGW